MIFNHLVNKPVHALWRRCSLSSLYYGLNDEILSDLHEKGGCLSTGTLATNHLAYIENIADPLKSV